MSDEPVIDDPAPEPPPEPGLDQMETSRFCNKSMAEQKGLHVELVHNDNVVGEFKGKNVT